MLVHKQELVTPLLFFWTDTCFVVLMIVDFSTGDVFTFPAWAMNDFLTRPTTEFSYKKLPTRYLSIPWYWYWKCFSCKIKSRHAQFLGWIATKYTNLNSVQCTKWELVGMHELCCWFRAKRMCSSDTSPAVLTDRQPQPDERVCCRYRVARVVGRVIIALSVNRLLGV